MEHVKENLHSVQKRLLSKELASKWERIISIATFVGAIGAAALNDSRKRRPKPKRR